jgi:hypothetical protein
MASSFSSNNSNKAAKSHLTKSVKFHPYSYTSTSNNSYRNAQQTNKNSKMISANEFVIEKENFFPNNNNNNINRNNRNINTNNKNERSLRPIEHNELELNNNYKSFLNSANKKGFYRFLFILKLH